jgi:hypothetical protein
LSVDIVQPRKAANDIEIPMPRMKKALAKSPRFKRLRFFLLVFKKICSLENIFRASSSPVWYSSNNLNNENEVKKK